MIRWWLCTDAWGKYLDERDDGNGRDGAEDEALPERRPDLP